MTLANVRKGETGCLEAERIVDVCQVLGPDPLDAIRHLIECTDCQAVVKTLVAVHQAYDSGTERVEVLAERVLGELDLSGQDVLEADWTPETPRPKGVGGWGFAVANWGVAALAGFWGVLLVSSGSLPVGLQGAAVAGVLVGFIPSIGERMWAPRRGPVY